MASKKNRGLLVYKENPGQRKILLKLTAKGFFITYARCISSWGQKLTSVPFFPDSISNNPWF